MIVDIFAQFLSVRVVAAAVLIPLIYWIIKEIKFAFFSNLPPGPIGLPFVGIYPFLQLRKLHRTYYDHFMKYGPISSYRSGQRLFVLLSGQDTLREAFATNDNNQRPPLMTYKQLTTDKFSLLAFNNGKFHEHARAIGHHAVTSYMRSPDSKLGEIVESYVKKMGQKMQETQGKPISTVDVFIDGVMEMIIKYFYGVETNADFSKTFFEFFDGFNNAFDSMWSSEAWPVTEPLYKKELALLKTQMNSYKSAIIDLIKAHKPGEKIEYLADAMHKMYLEFPESKKRQVGMTDHDIKLVLIDLFDASTFTSWELLEWSLLYLARYPDVQRTLRREIQNHLGDHEMSFESVKSIDYATAVLYEIMRMCSLTALGIVHYCNADCKINGYDIPKGSVLVPNLFGANHNPKVFDEPMKFIPERFLNDDGSFNLRLAQDVAIFSFGRRKCPGEILARPEMSYLLAYVVRHFQIEKEPDPCDYDPFYGKMSFSFVAPVHKLSFKQVLPFCN